MVSNYERYEIDGDSDSDKEHNSATKRRLPEINGTQNKHQRLNSAFESLLEIRRNQTDRVDGEDDRRTDGDDEEVNRRTDRVDQEDDRNNRQADDADDGDSINDCSRGFHENDDNSEDDDA